MKTLNRAEGIVALKHSVKKKLAHYIVIKVKVCVGIPQRHMAVCFQSFLTLALCGLEESPSRSVSLILGKRVSGVCEIFQSFLSRQLEEQINPLPRPEIELLFNVCHNNTPLITSAIAGLCPQSPSHFA